MLTPPTVVDLVAFTGRAEDSFAPRVTTALRQAALLFTFRTCLSAYPDDPDRAELARFAIMELAERIYFESDHAETRFGPFSSETIGSYSYVRGTAASLARDGDPTGLLWWDLAVDELRDCGAAGSGIASGSIKTLQPDFYLSRDGETYLLGPADAEHIPGAQGYDHVDTSRG